MIRLIFWMPTDQVMAFLFFLIISRWTCLDRVGEGVGGVIIEKKQVCLKMLFRQFQVFLAHVFFFLLENRPSLPFICIIQIIKVANSQSLHGCQYWILTQKAENHTFFIPIIYPNSYLFHTKFSKILEINHTLTRK